MSDIDLRWLLTLEGQDPYDDTAAPVRFYFSNTGFTSAPTDTPRSTWFDARLRQASDTARSVFQAGATTGQSVVQRTDCVLDNNDGVLDYLSDYAFGGRFAELRCGPVTAGKSLLDYPATFVGTLDQQPLFNTVMIRLRLRDGKAPLSAPIQPRKYLGTNIGDMGLEGSDNDLGGKPKQLLFGGMSPIIPCPCVNAFKQIYEPYAGSIAQIGGIYDRGGELTYGGEYTSEAELLNNALAPSPGYYKAWAAGGYFRLGSVPSGAVTGRFCPGATPDQWTHAAIMAQVMVQGGIDPANLVAADFAQHALDVPGPASLFIGLADVAGSVVADRVANSAGSGWGARWYDAKLRFVQIKKPTGPVAQTFTTDDMPDASPLTQEDVRDKDLGRPAWRVVMRWGQNMLVQRPNDLNGDLPADWMNFLGTEWRTVAGVEDPAIKSRYADAIEFPVDSLFIAEADARREAVRVLALRGIQRYRFLLTVWYTPQSAARDIFDEVGIIHDRLNLQRYGDRAGDPQLVLGVSPNAANQTLQLSCWGASLTSRNIAARNGTPWFLKAHTGDPLISHSA